MAHASILKSTNLILAQDLGRWGYQHLGVSSAGASDKYALRWANTLLQNKINTPCLEFFLGSCELVFYAATRAAITGADCNAKLNGKDVTNWTAFNIKKGDVLTFKLPKNGLFSYLSVSGGFKIKSVLGSCAHTLREEIGPNSGRAFYKGDELPYDAVNHKTLQQTLRQTLHWSLHPRTSDTLIARVIPSADAEKQNINWQHVENSSYEILPDSNKMGLRLKGNTIPLTHTSGFSEAVVEGSVQIPGQGQPIILMADHQTIGGYPLLGCVYAVDIPLLAQSRPGQTLFFKKGCVEEAQQALRHQHKQFEQFSFIQHQRCKP